MSKQLPIDDNFLRKLGLEMLGTTIDAHRDLLSRFAKSEVNELRTEIRLFRTLLKEVAEWADPEDALCELAHRAHWWEGYWFEREYGDSQFEEIEYGDTTTFIQLKREFDCKLMELWVPLLDFDHLTSEIATSAVAPEILLSDLSRLSQEPGWSDLRYMINSLGPIASRLVIDSISAAVRKVNPAGYTRDFLDMLAEFPSVFRIGWDNMKSTIFVELLAHKERISSWGQLSEGTMEWLLCEEISQCYDQEIFLESHEDIDELFESMLEKAAA